MFEYKVLSLEETHSLTELALNNLAENGWRVACSVRIKEGYRIILEREKFEPLAEKDTKRCGNCKNFHDEFEDKDKMVYVGNCGIDGVKCNSETPACHNWDFKPEKTPKPDDGTEEVKP